jgi:lipoprotein-anchoring transpeptidase ErfK/SrfK
VNTPDETEFQMRLDHDPRFQRLMDQLAVPVGDNWHFGAECGQAQHSGKTGYYIEGTAKKSW